MRAQIKSHKNRVRIQGQDPVNLFKPKARRNDAIQFISGQQILQQETRQCQQKTNTLVRPRELRVSYLSFIPEVEDKEQ